MATALGLALQVSANTAGLTDGLAKADKALKGFSAQLNGVGKAMDKFASDTGELPVAMQNLVNQTAMLGDEFRRGAIPPEEMVKILRLVKEEANLLADTFKYGESVTAKYTSKTTIAKKEQERLDKALELGAIDMDIYNKASKAVTKTILQQSNAYKQRQAALSKDAQNIARAKQVTASVVTAQERYQKELIELNSLLKNSYISQETYNRALAKAQKTYKGVQTGARQLNTTLAEGVGVFALLPGPIGSAAARISSFFSAANGLTSLMKGGFNLSSVVTGFMKFVNPVTLATAAIFGFTTAAAAAFAGLKQLETQVELTDRAARLIGSSFDFAQGIQIATERVGRSFKETQEPLSRFQGQLQKARDGNEAAARGFELLGFSLEQISAASPDELLLDIADRIEAIEDPTRKAAAELALFGEQGPKLRDVWSAMRDGVEDAIRLNAALSDLEKKEILNFGKDVDELNTSFQGFTTSILTPLAGAFAPITDGVSALFAEFGDLIGLVLDVLSPALTALGNGIGAIFRGAATLIKAFNTALQPIRTIFKNINQVMIQGYEILEEWFDGIDLVLGKAQKVVNYFYSWFESTEKTKRELEEAAKAAEELEKTFIDVEDESKLISENLAQVGQAGFESAQKYREQLEMIVELQREGELNAEQAARAVENARAEYEQVTAELVKQQEAVAKRIADEQKIVEKLEEQYKIDQEFGGSKERYEAANAQLAITNEIARVEKEIANARARGDDEAVAAGNKRLQQLDQIGAEQERIASGQAERDEKMAERQKKLAEAQKAAAEELAEIAADIASPDLNPLKAVDANSAAGMEEAFRITQGADKSKEVQLKQLDKLEEIKEAILDEQIAEIAIPG